LAASGRAERSANGKELIPRRAPSLNRSIYSVRLGHRQEWIEGEMERMAQIRILVRRMPGVLTDIVTRLLDQAQDLDVAMSEEDDFEATFNRSQPDIVVLTCDESERQELGSRLLRKHPALKVLTIVGDGRNAFLYLTAPQELMLGELSPESLISTIRSFSTEETSAPRPAGHPVADTGG
jgi:hypothetical protein